MIVSSKRIHVLYSLDDAGVGLLLVSLFSLLKNKSSHSYYYITIACKQLTNTNIANIKKIVSTCDKCNVSFVDCTEYDVEYDIASIFHKEDNVLNIYWPSPMYYYFLASAFYDSSVEKIIYLDIDTIIQGDLSDLYNQPALTTFTGCKCNVIIPYIKYQNQMNSIGLFDQINVKYKGFFDKNINKYDSYLNSGVLIINLTKLRNVNLRDLFKCAHDNHFNDQDLLSFYFWNDITNIHIKYNFCIHFFTDKIYHKQLELNEITIDELQNYKKFMYITHVSTRPKPTHFFNNDTLKLIQNFGGISNYVDALTHMEQTIKSIGASLNKDEYDCLKSLSQLWANRIYGSTQKTRLYEHVFYQWGLLWWEMINKNYD